MCVILGAKTCSFVSKLKENNLPKLFIPNLNLKLLKFLNQSDGSMIVWTRAFY